MIDGCEADGPAERRRDLRDRRRDAIHRTERGREVLERARAAVRESQDEGTIRPAKARRPIGWGRVAEGERTVPPSNRGRTERRMTKRPLTLAALALAAAAVGAGTASAAPRTLGAYWHFDENGGPTAADSSANANTATLGGGASWTAGRFGSALAFDGLNDEVRAAPSASLRPSAVTVEGWIRASGSPGAYRHIVAQGASACTNASYGLYSGANGGLAFYIASGNDRFSVSPDAGTGVWDGNWHHVAGTFDGTTVRLFVDGAEVGTGTPASVGIDYSSTSSLDLLLGQYGGPCSTTHAYAGMLDEPRIWDRALGADEIAASAAMGAGPADRLAMDDAATDPIVYTSRFTDGKDLVISTESSSGTRTIRNVTIADPIPYGWLVTCGRLLSTQCRFGLSNGDRTATLNLVPVLPSLNPGIAHLRVSLTDGDSFIVTVRP